jgi:hypothetical protein
MELVRKAFNAGVSISGVERSGWTSTELVYLETVGMATRNVRGVTGRCYCC